MRSLLSAFAAMCSRELFQFYLSLKVVTSAPWTSMFLSSSYLPCSANFLMVSLSPFISSTWSYISLVGIGSKQ